MTTVDLVHDELYDGLADHGLIHCATTQTANAGQSLNCIAGNHIRLHEGGYPHGADHG